MESTSGALKCGTIKENQIPSKLEALERAITECQQRYDILYGRLSSVLRLPVPAEENVACDKQQEVPLAEIISTCTARVKVITSNINDTLDRLEL